jgi:hypothetical protein
MNKTSKTATSKSVSRRVAATSNKTQLASKADVRKKIFTDNLPCFNVTVRGNVVADSENVVSKAGNEFVSFRIAYTRIVKEEKISMFIKVMLKDGGENGFGKGAYVEVTGQYQDDLGEYQGKPTVYRT